MGKCMRICNTPACIKDRPRISPHTRNFKCDVFLLWFSRQRLLGLHERARTCAETPDSKSAPVSNPLSARVRGVLLLTPGVLGVLWFLPGVAGASIFHLGVTGLVPNDPGVPGMGSQYHAGGELGMPLAVRGVCASSMALPSASSPSSPCSGGVSSSITAGHTHNRQDSRFGKCIECAVAMAPRDVAHVRSGELRFRHTAEEWISKRRLDATANAACEHGCPGTLLGHAFTCGTCVQNCVGYGPTDRFMLAQKP